MLPNGSLKKTLNNKEISQKLYHGGKKKKKTTIKHSLHIFTKLNAYRERYFIHTDI